MRSWFAGLVLLSPAGCFGTSEREVDASVDVREDAPSVTSDRCGSADPYVRSLCAMVILHACFPSAHPAPEEPGTRLETRECLIRAGANCDAVADCIGRWVDPNPEPCNDYCDGDILVRCEGGRIRQDCARTAPGNRCFGPSDQNPRARCSTESCIAVPSSSCTADGHIQSCDRWSDRRVTECPSDTPCAPANGFLDCTGRGPRCTQTRCESSGRMIPCVNGQEGSPRDCDAGMVCGTSGICDFVVTPLCNGSGSSYTCDGTDFLYCNYAQTTRISCTALGFTRCEYVDRTFTATCR